MAPSHVAKAITAIGIQDSGEIIRRNWNGMLVTSRSTWKRPTRMPTGTPIAMAMTIPCSTRCRLGTVICIASPEDSISPRRVSAGSGAKSANAVVAGLF